MAPATCVAVSEKGTGRVETMPTGSPGATGLTSADLSALREEPVLPAAARQPRGAALATKRLKCCEWQL
jgi:hypothetical protein